MIAAFRLLAFLFSAAGIELLRGVGAVAAVVACGAGVARATPIAVLAVAIAGAVLSMLLPDGTDASGKVAHGLSNAPVVLVVYILLSGAGYGIGRIGRRLIGLR